MKAEKVGNKYKTRVYAYTDLSGKKHYKAFTAETEEEALLLAKTFDRKQYLRNQKNMQRPYKYRQVKHDEYLLYFIKNETTGNVKVGITSDLDKRVKKLQTGNDCRLIVLNAIPFSKEMALKAESSIHKRFKAYRCLPDLYSHEWLFGEIIEKLPKTKNEVIEFIREGEK